jgi:hypothetical protein
MDGANKYSNTGTIINPPPIPNKPAANPEKAPRRINRIMASLIAHQINGKLMPSKYVQRNAFYT